MFARWMHRWDMFSVDKLPREQVRSYRGLWTPQQSDVSPNPVGADLSAKRPINPTHLQRLTDWIRGQVRSHKFCVRSGLRQRLKLTVGADSSAKRPVNPTHFKRLTHCIRGQVRSHKFCVRSGLRQRLKPTVGADSSAKRQSIPHISCV